MFSRVRRAASLAWRMVDAMAEGPDLVTVVLERQVEAATPMSVLPINATAASWRKRRTASLFSD
jgi:hypothetical protein